jgi:protein O-mannosyl-transferase
MLVSFGLALLFKAQAITFPAILIVLDIYLVVRVAGDPLRWFGRSYKAVLLNRLPFIGLAFIFAVVAYRAKASTFYGAPVPARGPLTDIAVVCYGYCYYVFKTLISCDVAAIHTLPGPLVWTNPYLTIALFAVGGASAAILLGRRRWPGVLAVWVVSLALLSPAPGLLSLSLQLVANRYTYVAAMVSLQPWPLLGGTR